MTDYYLAVDIGASSGRHILGWLENGKMKQKEIYRFDNGMVNRNGKLLWDIPYLFGEIVKGMKKCRELDMIPLSMAVDTWAVDFVLLDEKDNVLGDTYAYRDKRTKAALQEVFKSISEKELYAKTGIQKQNFNTIYQLMAVKMNTPKLLKKAETFLMLPDYFHFLLTGNKISEYTNATSTQLINTKTKQWDSNLIKELGYPLDIFLPVKLPGTKVGNLKREIAEEVGFDCDVVLCASHDTASAVMAVPNESGEGIYISSGTWSLMGVETKEALCDEESRQDNFTNEGGYEYRFRYLKNIMGLWMIQSVRHEFGDKYSFAQLCDMAEECSGFPSRVDVNSQIFLAPESMIGAIKSECISTGQQIPESVGEIAAVIYRSLAECYAQTVTQIERNTKKKYDEIYIIGGGSNAAYLNKLTADITNRNVYAGPSEATAIGNLMAQMIRKGAFENVKAARKCIKESFDVEVFEPDNRMRNR